MRTMFIGKVDTIGNESVQTKFAQLGLPIYPIASYYSLGASQEGIHGFGISLHWKSILIGYMRWWLPVFAILFGLFALATGEAKWGAISLVGLFLAVGTIWFGQLTPGERGRRQVLLTTTGLGAPPKILPATLLDETYTNLELQWRQLSDGIAPGDWRNVTEWDKVDTRLLPLLFCLAMYENREDIARNAWWMVERVATFQPGLTPGGCA